MTVRKMTRRVIQRLLGDLRARLVPRWWLGIIGLFLAHHLLGPTEAVANIRELAVVDAIAIKPDASTVSLLLYQPEAWSREVDLRVQIKTLAYKAHVQNGAFATNHPEAKDRRVRIILVYVYAPPSTLLRSLHALKSDLGRAGFEFVWGTMSELPALANAP